MGRRFRRNCLIVVGAILLLVGSLFWYRSRSTAVLSPPEIPSTVVDAEVRSSLQRSRNRLLADPNSGQAWGDLGLVFRAHGLNSESNDCFQQAARLDPKNPRWPYLIGMSRLLVTPTEAIQDLQFANSLATLEDHKSYIRLRLAEVQLELGKIEQANELFQEEAKLHPLNIRAQFGLGVIASVRGEDEVAIRYLKVAESSPHARRKTAGLLAACYRRLGNKEEVDRFERNATQMPDDFPWPDEFLGEYSRKESGRSARMKAIEELESSGRIQEAVVALDELSQTFSDDQVLVSLGINQAKMGDFQRAERTLRLVLTRTPDHAVARYFLGISIYMQAERLVKSGDTSKSELLFNEAIRELRRSAELKPDQGMAHLYTGLALKYLGKLSEAEQACRLAVRTSPQFAEIHLELAQVLLALNKSDEAKTSLETAIRLSPPKDQRSKELLDKLTKSKP